MRLGKRNESVALLSIALKKGIDSMLTSCRRAGVRVLSEQVAPRGTVLLDDLRLEISPGGLEDNVAESGGDIFVAARFQFGQARSLPLLLR